MHRRRLVFPAAPPIAASPQEAHDPLPVSVAYHTLPILIGAAVLRMLVSDGLDFSAVLFGITF